MSTLKRRDLSVEVGSTNGGRGKASSPVTVGGGICGLGRSRLSPAVKLLQRLGARLAKAVRFMSMRRRKQIIRSSRKVSSSNSLLSSSSWGHHHHHHDSHPHHLLSHHHHVVLVRSRSCTADPIINEFHRAQAVEDCIEFLNSSSSCSYSLPRSSSVSSYQCLN